MAHAGAAIIATTRSAGQGRCAENMLFLTVRSWHGPLLKGRATERVRGSAQKQAAAPLRRPHFETLFSHWRACSAVWASRSLSQRRIAASRYARVAARL